MQSKSSFSLFGECGSFDEMYSSFIALSSLAAHSTSHFKFESHKKSFIFPLNDNDKRYIVYMKIKLNELKQVIRKILREAKREPKEFDPKYWGMADTDVSKKTLRSWLEQMTLDEANHIMFVDDMEGIGLTEAIEEGDLQLANALTQTIKERFPFSEYNPFSGESPKRDPFEN